MGLAASAALWATASQAVVGGREGGPLEASALMLLVEGGGMCTGLVVDRRAVLTAAHCVPPGRQVRLHWREGERPVLVEPSGIARHPEFRANAVAERTRSIDLALVSVAEPLPARFEPAPLSASVPDGAVTVGGYGVAREGDPRSNGVWRTVQLRTTRPYGEGRVLVWAEGAPGSGACQGDSGGPLAGSDGIPVALVSWTTGQGGGSRCGRLTQGVLLGPQRGWIDAQLRRQGQQASWR